MNTLREALILTDARAISLTRQITKDGNTFVLIVKGPLTPELAETLRCRNQAYNLSDTPYPSLKALSLDHEIFNCELTVPIPGAFGPGLKPTVVTGFSIRPSEAADADGALDLTFRMKFTVGKNELNALLDAVGNNPFDLSLLSLQGGLFDQTSKTEFDGAAGGTRVDVTGGGPNEEDEEEDDGQEPPPPLVEAMLQDGPEVVDETIRTGSLASAREMAGGTTEAAKKQKRASAARDVN